MNKELTEFESDPYSLFMFAINSPLSKEKYVPRLNSFFDFIKLKGTVQEKCITFAKKSKDEPLCVLGCLKIPSNEQGKDRKERDYRRNGTELRQDYKVIF